MAETTEVDYGKYLEANPTQLMVHIEKWLKDKTGFDPKSARTKDEAFSAGVRLTVHLRGVHQASPENQARLAENRQNAAKADDAKAVKREERAAVGAKPRGRLPKTAAEDKATEPATPKRRGRPPKAKAVEEPVAETAPPKRRGRPRKAAQEAVAEATETANVTPIRRARTAKAAAPAEPATEATKPVRRRPVRREGEAAF